MRSRSFLRRLVLTGVMVGLGLVSVLGGRVRAGVLWQIGKFDASSAEMKPWIHPVTGQRQIDYTDATSDARFVIGKSSESSDWPAYQPGTSNGEAGFRAHPATIEFELPGPPERDLRLRVALLAYSARLPALEIEANGWRGRFFQEPTIVRSAGDPAVFFQPHYATSVVSCVLPAARFRAGVNRLVLTAVDVPGAREDVRPSGFPWPGCSGLVYDALVLEELPEGEEEPELSVRVEPTVFHREREGRLFEELDVFLRFRSRPPEGRVRCRMRVGGDVEVSAGFAAGTDFGEERVTLEMPAWEGVQPVRVRVEHAGGEREFERELRAGRRWSLWVVPHEHLDVGYTDDEAKIAELQTRVLEDAMDLSEQRSGFSFTVDGQWVVEEYWRGRGAVSRERLVRAMREGRIHVPVVHGSLFTGSASLEGMVRSLYPSRNFSREHGTPFDVAVITDVPSYSWSMASVLAASGVRYFVGASDAYRGPFLLFNRLDERSPHAWEGPDGGRVTTWYSRHYHQVSSLFGLPPRLSLGRESLPRFLQAYDTPQYRADEVLLYGTQVENVALQPAQAGLVEEWNRVYAFPRMRFGGFAAALASIERKQGTLEVVRGDGGPYWEDGLAANARVTAIARENSRRLPSAEKAARLAAMADTNFVADAEDLARAWRQSLLIDEHTWHADCSVRDPMSAQAQRQGGAKDARAPEARRSLERVLSRSLSALGEVIPAGPGSVVLFNPLSWDRGGVVEMEIGRGQGLVDPSTGLAIPLESRREGPVYRRVRFMAPEIPGLGYRTLALRPMPVAQKPAVSADSQVLENRWYRVELDPERGGIRSWRERATGREWVDASQPLALGQWVYVTGGDPLPNRIVQYSTVSPVPVLALHPGGAGKLVSSVRTPVGAVAVMRTVALRFPGIETEIWLPEDRPEVRIELRVRKEEGLEKEAAYVAFPLSVREPVFRYATQNGWVDPSRDLLPGACREWFSIQDWLAVSGEGGTVALSAPDTPLMTLGDVVRGVWPQAFGRRPSTVFSYCMSNYTPEGYAAGQGGDFVFRYVLTTFGDFDAAAVARFGAETMTPVEKSEITRSDKLSASGKNDWDPVAGPGLRVEPSSVHVNAWKSAEDGRGEILRLVETSGRSTGARIGAYRGVMSRVTRCSAVEDDLESVPVSDGGVRVTIPAFGLVTLRVEWEGR